MARVLITGVGKGIGKALCEKFLAERHEVFGTYFESKPQITIRQPADKAQLVQLDLSQSESIKNCVGELQSALKNEKFDILINNAGAIFDDEERELKPKQLRSTLEVNVIGTADFTERLLPMIREGGHIINISSTAGSLSLAVSGQSHFPDHYPAYKISKAALNMYTVTLARRLSARRIIVSAVHPGWVRTDMGGEEADISPEEAAADIYKFAMSRPATGGFWHKGKHLPW